MSTSTQTIDVSLKDVRIATWICFFAWTFAVYDFILFGNLLPVIGDDLGWSGSQSTLINTFVTAGTALVAFAVGPFVDRFGRRRGIIVSVVGAAVASLMTAAAGWVAGAVSLVGIVFLIAVRSLAGLGYAEQAINAAYLSEMFDHVYTDPAKARRRGFIYSLVQAGWPVGSVLAAGSIALLKPIGDWELCFIVGVFPAFFMVAGARWLKESPSFSARMAVERERTAVPLRSMFRGAQGRMTAILCGSFLLNWFGVVAFSILGTSLLTADDGKGISFDNALLILIISNGTAFAGYLFHGWLGDQIGRRNTIGTGWLLAGAAFAALLAAPSGNFTVAVTLYSIGLFFLIGPFSAILLYTGESFPSQTRASGSSLVNASGQVGAVAANLLITVTLAVGGTWLTATLWWGVIPVLASGALIFAARKPSGSGAHVHPPAAAAGPE
ncbi:MFS transporter [Gordonia sputi]|uniref:MFS transporter n=1 Tax=Gordonia sputi TaxID=36823 RepID=UPI002043BC49|nr:MFS transporter [Gordonia sputi]MCM3897890.1 MFS transporter [Gordonia sputi]